MIAKLLLPFSLLSDPAGDLIKQFGFWSAEEKISKPGIIVTSSGGKLLYSYVGEDFADRPGDDLVFDALKSAQHE